jgi:hypothetical protein
MVAGGNHRERGKSDRAQPKLALATADNEIGSVGSDASGLSATPTTATWSRLFVPRGAMRASESYRPCARGQFVSFERRQQLADLASGRWLTCSNCSNRFNLKQKIWIRQTS